MPNMLLDVPQAAVASKTDFLPDTLPDWRSKFSAGAAETAGDAELLFLLTYRDTNRNMAFVTSNVLQAIEKQQQRWEEPAPALRSAAAEVFPLFHLEHPAKAWELFTVFRLDECAAFRGGIEALARCSWEHVERVRERYPQILDANDPQVREAAQIAARRAGSGAEIALLQSTYGLSAEAAGEAVRFNCGVRLHLAEVAVVIDLLQAAQLSLDLRRLDSPQDREMCQLATNGFMRLLQRGDLAQARMLKERLHLPIRSNPDVDDIRETAKRAGARWPELAAELTQLCEL